MFIAFDLDFVPWVGLSQRIAVKFPVEYKMSPSFEKLGRNVLMMSNSYDVIIKFEITNVGDLRIHTYVVQGTFIIQSVAIRGKASLD